MLVAVDTETELFPPQGERANRHAEVGRLVLVSWFDGVEAGTIPWDDVEGIRALFSRSATFVFHNAKYDLRALTDAHPALRPLLEGAVMDGRVLDTIVLYRMRNPDPADKRATLDGLAARLLGRRLSKATHLRLGFSRAVAPSSEQLQYAITDAVVTRDLARLLADMPYGELRDHATPQVDVSFGPGMGAGIHPPDVLWSKASALQAWYLQPTGMLVHRAEVEALRDGLEAEVAEHEAALVEAGLACVVRRPRAPVGELPPAEGQEVSGGAWRRHTLFPPTVVRRWKGVAQVCAADVRVLDAPLRAAFQAVADENGLTLPRSEKRDAISVSRDDWRDYEHLLPERLSVYMRLQRARKYLAAFVRPLMEPGVRRVYPDYWIPGAATGRWACSRPNLQQFPRKRTVGGRKMAGAFCPEPGKVFVSADYPTLELYCLAHAMQQQGIVGPLVQALGAAVDVHTQTASAMFTLAPGDVTREQRQAAKIANFSLAGGMGCRLFHYQARLAGLDWDPDYAKEIRDRWMATYPDVKQYLAQFRVNAWKLRPPYLPPCVWLRELGIEATGAVSGWDVMMAHNRGRIFRVTLPDGRIVTDRGFSQAANLPFQGMGAAVITRAFVKVCAARLNPVAVVHDSVTLEEDAKEAEGIGRVLGACMLDAMGETLPGIPLPRQITAEVHDRSWA